MIDEPVFRAETARAYEGLFTLGSGYLHVRGSLEEHLSDAPQNVEYTRLPTNVTSERFPETKAKWGTYVPGVFGPHPLLNREMINLPWFLGLAPIVDGERLDVEKCQIDDYQRELRLKDATLTRRIRWRTKFGAAVIIEFERFISAARPHICAQRMKLTSDRTVELRIEAGIDADVRTNGYDHFRRVMLKQVGANGVGCLLRTNDEDAVEMIARIGGPGCDWQYEETPRAATLTADLKLAGQHELIIEKSTAVATSRDLAVRGVARRACRGLAGTLAELRRGGRG
jgi:trehalose/maltose hydrolase-like predicted phosphorylase